MQCRCSDKLYTNTAYYLHKGSFSHPCGNPMACKSTLFIYIYRLFVVVHIPI